MADIDEIFRCVAGFRADVVREKCRSNDDLLMLASQFAFQAAQIYEKIGGQHLVAAQFYAVADKAAGTASPPAQNTSDR